VSEPFRTIVADPPWPFGDKLPGPKRGAVKHYKGMSLDGTNPALLYGYGSVPRH